MGNSARTAPHGRCSGESTSAWEQRHRVGNKDDCRLGTFPELQCVESSPAGNVRVITSQLGGLALGLDQPQLVPSSTASADSTSRNHLYHGRQPPPVVAASIILVCGLRVFHGSNPQTNGPPSPSCGSIPVRIQPRLGTRMTGPSGLGTGWYTVSLNRWTGRWILAGWRLNNTISIHKWSMINSFHIFRCISDSYFIPTHSWLYTIILYLFIFTTSTMACVRAVYFGDGFVIYVTISVLVLACIISGQGPSCLVVIVIRKP